MTDQRLERIVSNLLRTGVTVSAAMVLAGGIGYVIRHGREVADYRVFHVAQQQYVYAGSILRAALHGNFRALIQLGLLVLIATPVARVAFSIVAFWLEKDRTYVAITALVFAILLYSLVGKP